MFRHGMTTIKNAVDVCVKATQTRQARFAKQRRIKMCHDPMPQHCGKYLVDLRLNFETGAVVFSISDFIAKRPVPHVSKDV